MDRQTDMTGISPSRLLKPWGNGEAVWCHKCDLNHQLSHWQVTVCVPQGMCPICLPWVLHSSPPSWSSYTTMFIIFSHHTRSDNQQEFNQIDLNKGADLLQKYTRATSILIIDYLFRSYSNQVIVLYDMTTIYKQISLSFGHLLGQNKQFGVTCFRKQWLVFFP